MSDIKAGGAYVEIGGKNQGLKKSLEQAGDMLKDFGAQIAKVGVGMSLIGGAVAGGLASAGKHVADLAEKTSNLQAKTGMSLKAIAAIQSLAADSGVSAESFGSGIKAMQRNIADGGKEAKESFARLGTSMEQLNSLSPEDALGRLADQLLLVTDQNEKAALAQSVFGRAGVDMLPALAAGSAGLNEAGQNAERFGTVFTQKTLGAALAADNAFDNLSHAMRGLTQAIGNGIIPVLTPLAENMSRVVAGVTAWVDQNNEALKTAWNISIGVAGVGLAFTALGAGIAAAMSPMVLAIAGIAGIGMSLAAVLDVMGVTDLGFGELVNSIRINGTGLATWFGVIAAKIALAFDYAFGWIAKGFRWLYVNNVDIGVQMFDALVWVPQKLVQAFDKMGADIAGALNSIIDVANSVLDAVGLDKIQVKIADNKEIEDFFQKLRDQAEGFRQNTITNMFRGDKTREQERKQYEGLTEQDIQKAFAKDPQNGTGGFSFDTSNIKAALAKVGGNISALMEALFANFKAKFPEKDKASKGENPFGNKDATPLGAKLLAKQDFSSSGTFSGSVGAGLAGSGVFNQQLEVQREMLGALKHIGQNTAYELGD